MSCGGAPVLGSGFRVSPRTRPRLAIWTTASTPLAKAKADSSWRRSKVAHAGHSHIP
jgi:hypothetical protein